MLKIPLFITSALMGSITQASFAQESPFSSRYGVLSEICLTGSQTDCADYLLPLLSDVRAATNGPAYDLEITAIALAVVNSYIATPTRTSQECAVAAGALTEVARSAADPGQNTQILAIAVQVQACAGLTTGIERLLASPN